MAKDEDQIRILRIYEFVKDGHRPPHLFKCAGPSCPGLPWPASVLEHPVDCAAAVATK